MSRLAEDHIALQLGSELVRLRPTLRCGLRLERREGSFAKLIEDLEGGSLTAAQFVIEDHFRRMGLGFLILEAGLEKVCVQLIAFVLQCAGIDPDAKSTGDGASVSFAEHLLSLYRIGAGWLGWTPETTLNSTPAEIVEAYKGRIEMLKAIFGGETETKPTKATADHLRDTFRAMGSKVVRLNKAVPNA